MVITFSNIKGSTGGGGGGATGGTVSGITLWSDETTKAYIDNALSGVTDVLSAYTKTEDFATINGSAITSGGNLVIEATPYSAGTNIDITDHVISVTGITVPTSNTAFTNDAGYVTSGEVETQITGKNYATESWVQDNINLAIESETARTESTYAKIGDIPSLDGYATTGWVESQGYLTEHQDISGKLDTSDFTAYTANTQTELNNKQDISGMTAYYTSAQTDTAIQNATNGLASEEWVESKGYITGYTETDPVFQASAASGISEQDITNWNAKLDSSDLEPYYTSAQTNNAISDAVSGKADSSAVTAQISEVKAQIEAEIPSKVSDLQNDLNFASTGDVESMISGFTTSADVKTQIEGYNYINSEQAQTQIDNSISGKLDTSVFTAYTANTQTELNNKQDASAMTAYATTAFTESTYLKEHQSLSAYSTTEQVQTLINTAKQEVENEIPDVSNFVTSAQVETQITDKGYITGYTETDPVFMASAASGISAQDITNWNAKLDSSALTPYYTSAQTDNAISNAVSGKVDSSRVDEIEEVTASALVELHSTKQDTLVSGTNIKTINNQSLLGSGNIEIQGGGGSNIIEITQAEYDALTAYTEGAMYVITDSQAINMDNYVTTGDLGSYYTSAQTDTAISNAVSGKTDKVSVTANDFEFIFPTWNDQGCITGASATAYLTLQNINDSYITVFSDSDFPLPTIYAPESEGSAGQPLLSNGGGAPVWASYKFQFISQSQYDALATKDSTTIYFIVNEN